jgi:transcription elongation GreA/GreB family factor
MIPYQDMKDEKLLILEFDREVAEARIVEIEQKILDLAPEIHEALTQSSETWHDNAPFESLRDKRSAYIAEIRSIKATLYNSTKQIPRGKPDVVNVGHKVSVHNQKTGKQNTYYLTGDWTLMAGEQHEGSVVVSRRSPLGQTLIGKRVGEPFVFNGAEMVVTTVG